MRGKAGMVVRSSPRWAIREAIMLGLVVVVGACDLDSAWLPPPLPLLRRPFFALRIECGGRVFPKYDWKRSYLF